MIARRIAFLLPFVVAACAEDDGPGVFRQPSYSYLTKLRLNVATIEIDDRTPPVSPNALEALAPLRPVDALKQMASDRLLTAGSVGRAVFVMDAASLTKVGGSIEGRMAVHLDIYTGGATKVAFAEAQVARRRVGTDGGENPRAALYTFVSQMMDDMNVEFEFQVRRSLKEYLQETEGTAPPPARVESQDLSTPAQHAPVVSTNPTSSPEHVLIQPAR